jgi:hypothetical protein
VDSTKFRFTDCGVVGLLCCGVVVVGPAGEGRGLTQLSERLRVLPCSLGSVGLFFTKVSAIYMLCSWVAQSYVQRRTVP